MFVLQVAVILGICWVVISFPLFPLDDVVDQNYSGQVTVKISIDAVFYGISSVTDIIHLRKSLKHLYPIHLGDETIQLELNGTKLDLMHSTVAIPKHFKATTKWKNGTTTHTTRIDLSHFANQPFCLMHPADHSVTGLFNLCDGINGHYHDGKLRFDVRTRRHANSSTVSHLSKISQVRKPRGKNFSNVLRRMIGNSSVEFSRRRKKRSDDNVYLGNNYVELYIVADYDYYERVCLDEDKSRPDQCLDHIWAHLYTCSLVYLYEFGVALTAVGFELWADSNHIDIPINKDKNPPKEQTLAPINDYGKQLNRESVNYDAILFLTSTLGKNTDFIGLAPVGGLCVYPNYGFYVDDEGSDEEALITIVHELGHMFGADHVETLDCFRSDGKRTFLHEGE